jgi:hypothetical protein
MIKRFLFHRVHILADGTPMDQGIKDASLILSHITNTKFAIWNHAMMCAQITSHAVLREPLVEQSLF